MIENIKNKMLESLNINWESKFNQIHLLLNELRKIDLLFVFFKKEI